MQRIAIKRAIKKTLKIVSALVLAGAFLYFIRLPLQNFFLQIYVKFFPCARPIAYSIGSFDARFGISKDAFLRAAHEAEKIWEKPISKGLFTYSPDGDLKINLVYDFRQEATVKLRTLGITITEDKTSYDSLKTKYDALKSDYLTEKATLDARLNNFTNQKNAYETEVAYWNDHGGAPQKIYDRLTEEKNLLDNELQQINQLQTAVNATVDEINALVVVLKRLAASLNLTANQFNQIGEARGREFDEALYQSGPQGQEIDIYQFDNTAKLIRVLAHEFGHALGLEHVDNPKAIMYRLNQGTNEKLAPEDLGAIKKLCGIK